MNNLRNPLRMVFNVVKPLLTRSRVAWILVGIAGIEILVGWMLVLRIFLMLGI